MGANSVEQLPIALDLIDKGLAVGDLLPIEVLVFERRIESLLDQRCANNAVNDEPALIRFHIPAAFILGRVMPTGAELAYGFAGGWVTRSDVVAVALAKYEAEVPLTRPEEELALLLSDDLDRVGELVAKLETIDAPSEQRARLWLFLALAWLLEHRADFDDPLEIIEMIYADFDYPEEIAGLVRFMPAGAGDAAGPAALEERWRAFVGRVGAEYRQRDPDVAG